MKVVFFYFSSTRWFFEKLHVLLDRTKFILFFSSSSRLSLIFISFYIQSWLSLSPFISRLRYSFSFILHLAPSFTNVQPTFFIYLSISIYCVISIYILPPYILLLLVAVSFPTFLYSAALSPSIHLSIYLSFFLTIYLSIYSLKKWCYLLGNKYHFLQSIYLSIYLSTHLPLSLSLTLIWSLPFN